MVWYVTLPSGENISAPFLSEHLWKNWKRKCKESHPWPAIRAKLNYKIQWEKSVFWAQKEAEYEGIKMEGSETHWDTDIIYPLFFLLAGLRAATPTQHDPISLFTPFFPLLESQDARALGTTERSLPSFIKAGFSPFGFPLYRKILCFTFLSLPAMGLKLTWPCSSCRFCFQQKHLWTLHWWVSGVLELLLPPFLPLVSRASS